MQSRVKLTDDELVRLLPPKSKWHSVGSASSTDEILASGRQKLGWLVSSGLRPWHRVLDVGCGMGGVALPLLGHLDEQGSYEGFDIIPFGIEWCQERVTPRFPRFRFTCIEARNGMYERLGWVAPTEVRASEVVFPYADETFDFVFLFSVFTHLLPPDLERYVAQIRRVLKPGGRCLVTYFLLTERTRESMRSGKAAHRFQFPVEDGGSCLAEVRDNPEAALAYELDYLTELYARESLIIEQVHFGEWSTGGRWQDRILAER